jgi:hypothetical protein
MRKPRDLDAELKALAEKAKLLKERHVRELGALVIACQADALDIDILAGALLDAVATTDAAKREAWRTRGGAFFRNGTSSATRNAHHDSARTKARDGGAAQAGSQAGTQ